MPISYFVGASYSSRLDSCIGRSTRMMSDRGPILADEIVRRFNAGLSTYLMVDGHPSEVLLALRTLAKGARLTIGGRNVELTGSHALPGNVEDSRRWSLDGAVCIYDAVRHVRWQGAPRPPGPEARERRWRRGGGSWEWSDEELRARFRPVETGELLGDGRVERMVSLGRMEAVRLYCRRPGWLTTEHGLRVGQRWHEEMWGWAHGRPMDEEDNWIRLHEIHVTSLSWDLWETASTAALAALPEHRNHRIHPMSALPFTTEGRLRWIRKDQREARTTKMQAVRPTLRLVA